MSPPRRIVISGVGLVTPIGNSAWQTFRQLLSGVTVVDRAHQLPVTIDAVDLVRALGCVGVAQRTGSDPAVELAERAAREALLEASIEPDHVSAVLGSSKGAVLALTSALAAQLSRQHRRQLIPAATEPVLVPDAELAVALGPHGFLAWQLQRRLGVTGMDQVVASCASGLSALHQARALLLKRPPHGSAPQRILVLTSEATLLPAFIHSYRRLGVLAPLNRDQYRPRPLDLERSGFILAELGAAVVLEVTAEPRDGQIELVETAIATEPHDLVQSSPSMCALKKLAARLASQGQIDLVHPHATGTTDQDPAELAALSSALSESAQSTPPDLYAVKGALGHGLGAAGLVSLVVACLCARSNRRPPMPWIEHPIDRGLLIAPFPSRHEALRTHAVFAAGFGGHVAAALLRRA